ncbi:hypothetical protein Vretimale_17061 [Volvox reticuliferus]|uniref:Uncharacterized protein n=2 Tax=Volvox reticuliferus TaxID=1737510 RepID=A0A8J4FYB4_9CHLO|nr:hypothetical protein Vretifemale_18693 [Volvox reticuliferus]GIM14031.1 hypothetical protein Vretimale_17061 [Volvox reticuliferus]
MLRRSKSRDLWQFLFLYLAIGSSPRTAFSLSTCVISFLGSSDSNRFSRQLDADSICSCTASPSAGSQVFIFYAGGNRDLARLCNSWSGGDLHSPTGNLSGLGATTVLPWIDASPHNATSLKFVGGRDLVVDGALAGTPTAAKLDLSYNLPNMPVLYFYQINGLVLRNLVFRELQFTGPLILIEDCTNVTMQNVTMTNVIISGETPGVLPSSQSTDHMQPYVNGGIISHLDYDFPPAVYGASPPTYGGDLMHPSQSRQSDSGGKHAASMYGGAIWLKNVSTARLEGISMASFITPFSSPNGLLISGSQGISTTGLHVRNFTAGLYPDGRGTQSTSAVLIRHSISVTFSGLECSSSTASCGPCLGVIDSTVQVTDSGFMNNLAVNGSGGGAVCVQSSQSSVVETRVRFERSRFSGNTATYGGAITLIGFDAGAPTLDVSFCTFDTNSATDRGGDIYLCEGSQISVDSSSFSFSHATAKDEDKDKDKDTSRIYYGGCVYGGSGVLASFTNSTFEGCRASTHGGALYFTNVITDGSYLGSPQTSITLEGCRFTNNIVDSCGGGLAVIADVDPSHGEQLRMNVTITNSEFTGHSANEGAAIWLSNEQSTVVHYKRADPGIDSVLAAVHLHNVTFTNNIAVAGRGGAVFMDRWSFQLNGGEVSQNRGMNCASEVAQGGAIALFDCLGIAQISNVRMSENQGTSGGAIGTDWCSLNIRNAYFVDNSCDSDGGGMMAGCFGAADQNSNSNRNYTIYTIDLYNVTFEGNRATGGGGGLAASCGNLTVVDSRFVDNWSDSFAGGGMKIESALDRGIGTLPYIVLRGVHFVNNSAMHHGGGLYMSQTSATVEDTTFENNEQIFNCDGVCDAGGGAMYISKSQGVVEIHNVTVVGNSAAKGGAMLLDLTNATMRHINFTGNTAIYDGGALLAAQRSANAANTTYVVELEDSMFEHNVAGNDGGALKVNQSLFSATDVIFRGNKALGGSQGPSGASGRGGAVYLDVPWTEALKADNLTAAKLDHCQFVGNSAGDSGGALYNTAAIIDILSCRFLNNTAAGTNGNLGVWDSSGGAIYGAYSAMRLVDSELSYNRAEGRGGALALQSCVVTVEGSHIGDNVAKFSGGAVAVGRNLLSENVADFPLRLVNSNLTDNTAAVEHGGSLFVDALPISILHCRVDYNKAKLLGGAMYLATSFNLTVQSSALQGNKAEIAGGAVYAKGATGEQTSVASLLGVKFQDNSARTAGGALWLSDWQLQMEDLDMVTNSAGTFTVAGSDNSGGAAYIANCVGPADLSNSRILENAAYQGGAFYVELCSMSVQNVIFEGNSAVGGDAGAIAAIGFTSTSSITSNRTFALDFRNNTFQNNTAGGRSGALKAYFVDVMMVDTHFLDNYAVQEGGAVHLQVVPPSLLYGDQENQVADKILIERCEFRRNVASNSGGALYHVTSAVHLRNSIFFENIAGNGVGSTLTSSTSVAQGISTAGGAVFATSCTATMEVINTTLDSNQADGQGGGVALISCSTNFENSTLVDNVAKLSGGGVAAGHQVTISQIEAPSVTFHKCNLTRNKGVKEDGGSIFTTGVHLNLYSCQLLHNMALRHGGAVYSSYAPSVLMCDSILVGNSAGQSGGAMWVETATFVQVNGSDVLENAAQASGGAIGLSNTHCTHLDAMTIINNTASEGGGVYIGMPEFTVTPEVDNLTCVDGFEGLLGETWVQRLFHASQYIVKSKRNELVAVVTNVTAIDNRASSGQGGAALFVATRGSILLDAFNASCNRAGDAGGGIAISDSRLEGATIYLSSSEMANNIATVRGGAVSLDGSRTHQQFVALGTSMRFNTAGLGGAISLQLNASAALHGSVLDGNIADDGSEDGTGSGGSVYALSCNWLVVNSTSIEASYAGRGHGGGIYTDGCKVVMLSEVGLRNNYATGAGGAAFLSASSTTSAVTSLAVISRSDMVYNMAGVGLNPSSGSSSSIATASVDGGSAGALFVGGKMIVLIDKTTFDGNMAEAQGGAVGVGLECPQAPDTYASPMPESMFSSGNTNSSWLHQGMRTLNVGIRELPIAANPTLQALERAAKRSAAYSCWAAVFNQPRFWGNTAGSSGGAVFSTSPYTLSVICCVVSQQNVEAAGLSKEEADQIELAGLIDTTTTRVASSSISNGVFDLATGRSVTPSNGISNMTLPYMGLMPMSDTARAVCFRRPASSALVANGQQENIARMGYGDEVATAPKFVALVALDSSDTVSNYMANKLTVLGSSEPVAAYMSTENNGETGGLGVVNGSSTSSGSSHQMAQWSSRAVLLVSGRRSNRCSPGQDCILTVPNNAIVGVNVSIFDAADQVANDTGMLRSVVRATIYAADPNRRADLLGNPLAQVVEGSASLEGIRVRAYKGDYVLKLMLDTYTGLQVSPLVLNVTVPPCSLGELPLDGGSICSKCTLNTYSLTVDAYDDIEVSMNSRNLACKSCPLNAICTGGAVLVPAQGYWHSAANSTVMHQCPNLLACRGGDDGANDELVRCQERWYAYFGEASRLTKLAQDPAGGTTLIGTYLEAYRKVKSAGNNTYLESLIGSPLSLDGTFDGFLLDCALWGVASDDPLSYMQKQCAQGYSGILCATCTQVDGTDYAILSDLSCSPCFPKIATIFIGLAIFIANSLLLGASVLMTFLTDYTADHEPNTLPAADLLKVLVIHYQIFLIVTRIHMNWPKSILGLQYVIASVTGSVKQAYSPSCLFSAANSAEQATVQVLAGLLLPICSTILVMLLWIVRYFYWNQRDPSKILTHNRSTSTSASTTEDAPGLNNGGKGGKLADATQLQGLPKSSRSLLPNTSSVVSAVCTDGGDGTISSNTSGAPTTQASLGGGRPAKELCSASSTGSFVLPPDMLPTVAIVLGGGPPKDGAPAAPMNPAPLKQVAPPTVTPSMPAATILQKPAAPSYDDEVPLRSAFAIAQVSFAASYRKQTIDVSAHKPDVGRQAANVSATSFPNQKPLLLSESVPENSCLNTQPSGALLADSSGPVLRKAPSLRPAASMSQLLHVGADRGIHHCHSLDSNLSLLPSTVLAGHPPVSTVDSSEETKLKPSKDSQQLGLFSMFSTRESLSFVDSNLPLMPQLFLVLMVASFVLMPTWATEALSIFSCYKLDNVNGAYSENQKATWPYGYWVRDMNQECYTGRHQTFWLPFGVVSVLLLCLAMPITSAAITFYYRKRLNEVEVLQVYGFLYRTYKPKVFFWESVSQAQTLLLVVVEVFGRTMWVFNQALLFEIFLICILMLNTYVSPLLYEQLTALQQLSLGVICLTVVLGLFTSVPTAQVSKVGQNVLGAIILFINCMVFLGFLVLFIRYVMPTLKVKVKEVALHLRSSLSRLTSERSSTWPRLSSLLKQSFTALHGPRTEDTSGTDAAGGSRQQRASLKPDSADNGIPILSAVSIDV